MSSKPPGRVDRFVPDPIRRQFALKFTAVVLIAVVISAGVGAFYYVNATDRVEQQVTERATSTAQLQADGLSAWITGLRDRTRMWSAAGEFQGGDESAIQLFLMNERRTLPDDVSAIHYVDSATGRVLASSHREVDGARFADNGVPWAQDMTEIDAATNDATAVVVESDPYRSPATGERVIAFVSSPPKNTAHSVVVEASLDARASQFHQTTANASTTVVRGDGAYVMGARAANASIPAGVVGAGEAGLASTAESVVGYAPVEETGWTLTTRVSKGQAYAMRNYVGSSLLATTLATITAFAVATVLFGRRAARTLDDLADKARSMESGDLSVDLSTTRIDEFGRLFDAFDEMRDSLRDQIETAEAATASAEEARAEATQARREAEAITERLEARAGEYSNVMGACAEGDLTRRMDADVESDPMRRIALAYNGVMDEWEATIRRVRAFGESVQTASEDVTDTVATVRDRSVGVRNAASEMASGATTQSEDLQAALVELEDLSASVEEVSASADAVRSGADEVLEQGETGRSAAADAVDALDAIETSTDRTVSQVTELEELMADIEGVTDLIADVAEQTNMLALNANIEAERVDVNGDGFAVVADEIKTLADETVDATADIEASIDRMRGQMETTVSEIHETNRRVDTGSETIARALDAFDTIVDGMEETADGVREMDRATEEQAKSTQEVVAMVERVSEISEDTARESEAVVETSREQSTAIDEAERNLSRLADRAAELDAALRAFDVDGERGSTASNGERIDDAETVIEPVDEEGADRESSGEDEANGDDVGTDDDPGHGTQLFVAKPDGGADGQSSSE